jgi:hypothetical protein
MPTERLIYGTEVLSYNNPEHEGRIVPNECYVDAAANNKPGDTLCHFAGAPGCGRVVYVITRIDATGVYGHEVENTIRELDPFEVI